VSTVEVSPWAGTTPVASLVTSDGLVTLVEGQTFCLSGRTGDILPEHAHGLFVFDTRVLSGWRLRVNGHALEPLAVSVEDPFAATFVARGAPSAGRADADLLCFRRRHVGQGMRERVTISNHGLERCAVNVVLRCDVDFAGLFEVKENRQRARDRSVEVDGRTLRYLNTEHGTSRCTVLDFFDADSVQPGRISWERHLSPGESFELCVQLSVRIDGQELPARFSCTSAEDDADALPHQRMELWRVRLPRMTSDNADLTRAVERAGEDLGALRIFDPEHPDVPILAAGAPWFMTVFGRDSLLTAWMMLPAEPDLARGVVETLARFQGSEVDPVTEEEPGKILHEMRFGTSKGLSLRGGDIYYGTVDATPLFVMLLGELQRWDGADELVGRLLPHADRAMEWITRHGDRDGDGYVEYQRSSPDGLVNQGWKDSWDAVRFADGRLAEGPIALCEVQGYVYAAYRARAELASASGDDPMRRHCEQTAADLRRRFNEDFWVEERGWYALALDGDKRPVDALASNIGHCLWTGIVDAERAPLVAKQLLSPELFSGWGIRTLATSMPAYNPVSYHNGSVWPHDNALCIAGLARYGFMEEAGRVIAGQLAVASLHRGRLPELFAGIGRDELAVPAAYPTSCSPQAWASASPLLWLRSMLRLEPSANERTIRLQPQVPEWVGSIRLEGIRVADHHLTIEAEGGEASVEGAEGLTVTMGGGSSLSA
jgi:glycogen debranching enzyme